MDRCSDNSARAGASPCSLPGPQEDEGGGRGSPGRGASPACCCHLVPLAAPGPSAASPAGEALRGTAGERKEVLWVCVALSAVTNFPLKL